MVSMVLHDSIVYISPYPLSQVVTVEGGQWCQTVKELGSTPTQVSGTTIQHTRWPNPVEKNRGGNRRSNHTRIPEGLRVLTRIVIIEQHPKAALAPTTLAVIRVAKPNSPALSIRALAHSSMTHAPSWCMHHAVIVMRLLLCARRQNTGHSI